VVLLRWLSSSESLTLGPMKLYPYWARVVDWVDTQVGRQRLSAIGWSDVDETAARAHARLRLSRLAERLRHGFPERRDYLYDEERPFVEPRVDSVLDSAGQTVGVVTRNAYGALVLNTDRAMFIDVDFQPGGEPQGPFGGLFRKPKTPEELAQERVEAAAQSFGRWAFRVYRTFAGLRLVALGPDIESFDESHCRVLEHFGSDPMYVKLCAAQRCFRARLTPKPWRMGLHKPTARFPFAGPEDRARYDAWLERYDAKAQAYATCRLLTTLGLGHPSPATSALLAAHDRHTLRGDLPLA
jgi:hypothetical protein